MKIPLRFLLVLALPLSQGNLYGGEKQERLWKSVTTACQKMLAAQTAIQADAKKLREAVADKPPLRKHERAAARLAARQRALIAEANRVIALLEKDGSAVAFPEVFQQLRDDMKEMRARLDKSDLGPGTQTLEIDIIDTLKEMVGALGRKG